MNVIYTEGHIKAFSAECHYAEYHYVECCYTEYRSTPDTWSPQTLLAKKLFNFKVHDCLKS